MSIVNSKYRIMQSVLCEIDFLRLGNMSCANNILQERIEVMDRLWAMEKLVRENNSEYDSIITYLYEQIKELTLALTIKT